MAQLVKQIVVCRQWPPASN